MFSLKFHLLLFILIGVVKCEKPLISRISNEVIELSQPLESMLFLTCNVIKGTRPLKFQWSKNGRFLSSDSDNILIETKQSISHLTISQIAQKDAGNYSCKVSNRFGQDDLITILSVKGNNARFQCSPVCGAR